MNNRKHSEKAQQPMDFKHLVPMRVETDPAAVARIVARRRSAEKKALERRDARRQARLRAERDAAEARFATRRLGYYESVAMVPGALVELAARGIARLAVGAARALHRAYCVRCETRAASLLGAPTPAQLAEAWVPPRRSLSQALLIGSKLVDLSATHADTRQWSVDPSTGKRRLAGRAGGLKQYFADHCPTVRYSTAMRYRQLALRILRILETPAAIPLEWLLGDAAPESLTDDAALADAIRDGRRKLSDLLADIRSQRELTRMLDRKLDPDRLPNARRSSDPIRDAAASEAVFARLEARLRAMVASGRELTREEQRARALLQRLERLTGGR